LEVWITNRQNRINTVNNNLRNIIALQDIGEAQVPGVADNQVVVTPNTAGFFLKPSNTPADNKNNKYDPGMIKTGGGFLNQNIREIATASSGFNQPTTEGQDYSKLGKGAQAQPE
jgi:cell surface protein SprA